jgi:hypothetical protein
MDGLDFLRTFYFHRQSKPSTGSRDFTCWRGGAAQIKRSSASAHIDCCLFQFGLRIIHAHAKLSLCHQLFFRTFSQSGRLLEKQQANIRHDSQPSVRTWRAHKSSIVAGIFTCVCCVVSQLRVICSLFYRLATVLRQSAAISLMSGTGSAAKGIGQHDQKIVNAPKVCNKKKTGERRLMADVIRTPFKSGRRNVEEPE